MNPVAFEIFGISVRWYGILISLGMLLGMIIAVRECRRIGFDEEKLIDLLIFAIPLAIIGARMYYVIFNWEYYRGDILKIINIRGGGLAIHGGIIAAVIVALVYCKVRKVNFWEIADIVAPSIILGQAIGRWGNFINQEAYGTPTDLPWGIIVNGQKVHPTFLYESIWDFGVFLFLLWYRKNKVKVKGEVFLLYLMLYSFARFFIEGLRIDSLMLGKFRVAQLISIIIIAVSMVLFYKRRKRILE
ncbi:prolipoprotein diacylglyceryl transferase [Caloranaerobacter azorensis]|uniref:Phosphatidylglycerol--prolipoprotein diacylglyceryl transferase n=3 Tax=Caloranaerobacter azorensis TaxID=116090 RepID=A0A1M5U2P8_9FIRM|nr:prolipoprotein diacylglyceryl transferase [Caloranaerobacter azorensis]KGG80559.1 diacylglyceryl transferase [Caloranaerobacter azorensis H53214]QIB26702.1 prolipoprotein diacylglyceryl transferase [Caloranaerobacter azorensis]SHH57307.1 phosphatidylglycerol:prolipoprotein diacylglycerol transferase [Caloranaerobacter azorensis DSM 13643]